MKVDSFRELLIKKAQDDPVLQSFAKYIDKDVLADRVLESLEKMARAKHKGDTANLALRDFAQDIDPELHPHMIRDAIGHHVSNYKAALKDNRQDIANMHAKQAFSLMDMADRAQKHSGGKLSLEHVSPHPWERNKVGSRYEADHPKVLEGKYKEGDFKTKTKGLSYRGNDFSHLQEAPHESYVGEVRRHGHAGAYPFEHTRVNGKFIHVDDKDPKDIAGYESHPFDHHPIMQHYKEPAKNMTPEMNKQYLSDKHAYYNESPHVDNYFDRHEKLEQQDPEAYSKRGENASEHVHAHLNVKPIDVSKSPRKDAPVSPKKTESPLEIDSLHPDVLNIIGQHHPDLLARLKGGEDV
jgi:hypothetical protein